MSDKKTNQFNLLPTAAVVAAIAGAIGSLYFMFQMGRHQKSVLLVVLFTGWVLSPFVGLFLATLHPVRRHLSVPLIHWLMIVLSAGSWVAYSGLLPLSRTKGAFIYLVAPFTSWVVILLVLLIWWKRSKPEQSQREDGGQ